MNKMKLFRLSSALILLVASSMTVVAEEALSELKAEEVPSCELIDDYATLSEVKFRKVHETKVNIISVAKLSEVEVLKHAETVTACGSEPRIDINRGFTELICPAVVVAIPPWGQNSSCNVHPYNLYRKYFKDHSPGIVTPRFKVAYGLRDWYSSPEKQDEK